MQANGKYNYANKLLLKGGVKTHHYTAIGFVRFTPVYNCRWRGQIISYFVGVSYKKLNDTTYIYSQDVKSQSQNALLFQSVVWHNITINLMPCDNQISKQPISVTELGQP